MGKIQREGREREKICFKGHDEKGDLCVEEGVRERVRVVFVYV